MWKPLTSVLTWCKMSLADALICFAVTSSFTFAEVRAPHEALNVPVLCTATNNGNSTACLTNTLRKRNFLLYYFQLFKFLKYVFISKYICEISTSCFISTNNQCIVMVCFRLWSCCSVVCILDLPSLSPLFAADCSRP